MLQLGGLYLGLQLVGCLLVTEPTLDRELVPQVLPFICIYNVYGIDCEIMPTLASSLYFVHKNLVGFLLVKEQTLDRELVPQVTPFRA